MQAAQSEISHYPEADFIIINDNFNTALQEFKAIVSSQRCLGLKQQLRHADLLTDLLR
jgi:guanylate kinase